MAVGNSPLSPSSIDIAATVTAPKTATDALRLAQSRILNNPKDGQAWEALYVAWASIGEVTGAWNALQEWARCSPDQSDVAIRSIRFLLGTKDSPQALAYAEQAIIEHPENEKLLCLGIEAGLVEGHIEKVPQWAHQLRQHHPDRSVFAARALSRADRWTESMDILQTWLQQHPHDSSAWALKAELHLWAGATDAAQHAARLALEEHPKPPLAQMVIAIVHFRHGAFSDACALLDRIETPTNIGGVMELEASTLWCWKSLTRYEMGDLDAAVHAAKRALHSTGPLNLAAQILRSKMIFHQNMERSSQRRKRRPGFEINSLERVVDVWSYREILPRIEALLAQPAQAWSGVQRDLLDAYTEALENIGDNLSSTPTPSIANEGPPRVFQPPPLIRAQSRQLQHLLRTRSADAVLDMYRDLQRERPDAITPYTYMGEVLIWLGRTDEARTQLQIAIERDLTTQWAWIGLGAAALLEQQPEKAIELFDQGIESCRFEGPTMFVYRAECWLKLGQLDQALSDIDVALASKPQRFSAWLLRARIDGAMGDDTLANALMNVVADGCPHLYEPMTAQNRSLMESIDWALQAMKGNRSSSLPFFQHQHSTSLSFLRWTPKDWHRLRTHLRPKQKTKRSIWWETKPDVCRLGDCGPRCVGNERLQAWMGPSVGLERWLQQSEASQRVKSHSRRFLNHLQAQRRRVCPDLPDLRQQAEALVDLIHGERLNGLEITQLCHQLSACVQHNP